MACEEELEGCILEDVIECTEGIYNRLVRGVRGVAYLALTPEHH